MHSARENKKKKQKKRERKRNKKRLGVCECIGEGRRIQQAAKKDENPVNYARYFFVHLSRAPSLVWTISITTVLKFNDSEPNELHLDKFAFVGFVALVPRNTVNLTREPTGVMNYGEYEFVRPFFILHRPPLPPCSFSAIQRIPRIQSCLNPTQVSLDTPVNNTPYHSIVAHLDGFSRDGNVVRQKRKHCHAVW